MQFKNWIFYEKTTYNSLLLSLTSSFLIGSSFSSAAELDGSTISNRMRSSLQGKISNNLTQEDIVKSKISPSEYFVRVAIEMILESLRQQEMLKNNAVVNTETALNAGQDMFALGIVGFEKKRKLEEERLKQEIENERIRQEAEIARQEERRAFEQAQREIRQKQEHELEAQRKKERKQQLKAQKTAKKEKELDELIAAFKKDYEGEAGQEKFDTAINKMILIKAFIDLIKLTETKEIKERINKLQKNDSEAFLAMLFNENAIKAYNIYKQDADTTAHKIMRILLDNPDSTTDSDDDEKQKILKEEIKPEPIKLEPHVSKPEVLPQAYPNNHHHYEPKHETIKPKDEKTNFPQVIPQDNTVEKALEPKHNNTTNDEEFDMMAALKQKLANRKKALNRRQDDD